MPKQRKELTDLCHCPLVSRLIPVDALSRMLTNPVKAVQLEHAPRVTGTGISGPLRGASSNQVPQILVLVPIIVELVEYTGYEARLDCPASQPGVFVLCMGDVGEDLEGQHLSRDQMHNI